MYFWLVLSHAFPVSCPSTGLLPEGRRVVVGLVVGLAVVVCLVVVLLVVVLIVVGGVQFCTGRFVVGGVQFCTGCFVVVMTPWPA